jgi:hypothetical protein
VYIVFLELIYQYVIKKMSTLVLAPVGEHPLRQAVVAVMPKNGE